MPDFINVARAQRHHNIAGTRDVHEAICNVLHFGDVDDVPMSVRANRRRQFFACDVRNLRLARAVDRRDNQHICLIERTAEFVCQIAHALMTMRLEDTDETAFVTLARAVQRRFQLRRIVRVIVHDDNVICLPKHLKPAMHPLKRFKTLPNLLKPDV